MDQKNIRTFLLVFAGVLISSVIFFGYMRRNETPVHSPRPLPAEEPAAYQRVNLSPHIEIKNGKPVSSRLEIGTAESVVFFTKDSDASYEILSGDTDLGVIRGPGRDGSSPRHYELKPLAKGRLILEIKHEESREIIGTITIEIHE